MGHRPRSGILGDREYPGDREDGDDAVPPARPTSGPFSGGDIVFKVLTFGSWGPVLGRARGRAAALARRTVKNGDTPPRVSKRQCCIRGPGPSAASELGWGSMMMRRQAAPTSATEAQ